MVFALARSVFAFDQGDAPGLAQDRGADIGDVFAFQDPNVAGNTVLIATVQGFLIPGTVAQAAEYDASVRYRFEIYNDHVNLASPALNPAATAREKALYLARVKPNRTIDITFSKTERSVKARRRTLRARVQYQPTCAGRFPRKRRSGSGGFTGVRDKGVFTKDNAAGALTVTSFGVGASPSPSMSIRSTT